MDKYSDLLKIKAKKEHYQRDTLIALSQFFDYWNRRGLDRFVTQLHLTQFKTLFQKTLEL